MSVEAITWALRQPISHSSAKFVLVVLANCASAEKSHAWPSVAYLSSATGQDRKTVLHNLQRLQQWGLIEDTGKRVGDTKQIVVYKLICGPDLFAEQETVPKRGQSQKRDTSKNGTVPNSPDNSPVFPAKSPENGTRNRQEPKGTKEGEQRAPNGTRLPPDWQPSEADLEFARTERPDLDVKAEAAKFRDYWHAVPGADGRKADWPATWRNWIRRADAPKGAPAAQQQPSAPAKQRDWREPSESRLDNALAYIRNQFGIGAYGAGPEAEAERDRLIEEARRKFAPEKEAEAA